MSKQVSVRGDTYRRISAEARKRRIPIADMMQIVFAATMDGSPHNAPSVLDLPDTIPEEAFVQVFPKPADAAPSVFSFGKVKQ